MTDRTTRAKNRRAARKQRQNQTHARRRGELFTGDAQRNIFGGIEYLDPRRKRTDLQPETPSNGND